MNRHMKCQKIETEPKMSPNTEVEKWLCERLSEISGSTVNCVNRTLNQLEDEQLIESLNKIELQYKI